MALWPAVLTGTAAQAETLREAMTAAYLFNPQLKAQRAVLRAIDEEVPIAKSNSRPTVTGVIEGTYRDQNIKTKGFGRESNTIYTRSYSVGLSQPIFRGFRTLNAVKGAEASVESGREDLRSTEQDVFQIAVTAYMDVVRDQAILGLQQNNLKVLSEQLRATEDRFEVGEVTRTDVAQSRARRSGAESQVSAARANLEASRAAYQQVVGHAPTNLRDPGPLTTLPNSLEEALAVGEGENPVILAAIFNERAQDRRIKEIRGELLPEVTLEADYTKSYETGLGPSEEADVATVTGRVTVPIYQAGAVSARIRQAVETRSQLRQLIDVAREQVRADVISAWGVYTAARAQILSDQAQVEANRIALTGVREEERVGQRTVLDVLDAEQELVNSEVALVTTRRDLVVASYALYASIGRLSLANLDLPAEQYDPTEHFVEVRNKWYGFPWSTEVEPSDAPAVAPVNGDSWEPEVEGPAYRD